MPDLIDKRYEVISSMSEDTFLAVNTMTQVKWVMKRIDPKKLDTIKYLGFIRHPSLPRLYENIVEGEDLYCIFEFIEGKNLHELALEKGGSLDPVLAAKFILDISKAINFLHANKPHGLLHLDIKPSNIIIQEDGVACLIDFGGMIDMREAVSREGLKIATTKSFAPHELLTGCGIGAPSDVYMLGMSLLRLLVNVNKLDEPEKIIAGLKGPKVNELLPIIKKSSMYRPEDRYQSAQELIVDLEEYLRSTDLVTDQGPATIPKTGAKALTGQIIAVCENPHFAAEFATVLSEAGKRILLMDLDLLSGNLDMLVDISFENKKDRMDLLSSSNLSLLMNDHAINKLDSWRVEEVSHQVNKSGLKCICGDYRMEDYEHFSSDGLVSIIRQASTRFDLVILSSSKFIYDEFTCLSFICSDLILIPLLANPLNFREYSKYIEFLSARKQLDKETVYFIGFDYKSEEDLGFGVCQELSGNRYLGYISHSSRRRMLAGSSKFYCDHIEVKIRKQYLSLARKLKLGL